VATQEIKNILLNQKVHYSAHKSPRPVTLMDQLCPDHNTQSYLSKIHLHVIYPTISSSSDLFLSGLITNILYKHLFSLIPAKYLAHFMLL
jgi:hypothetical protein